MQIVLVVYWLALLLSLFVAGCLIGALLSPWFRTKLEEVIERVTGLKLMRAPHNPIMAPTTHHWEGEAVLNPAAQVIRGRTYLVYRAIGHDGVSRLGYASSKDGLVFDERLPYPAYVAAPADMMPRNLRNYNPRMYPSGGSWGGCEDPRMVVIDDTVYVSFNTFDNWQFRVAYLSMSVDDFVAKRFYKWDGPYLLSHNTRHKNWTIFPEKINGQFAVLHSIIGDTPDVVRVAYADDLKDVTHMPFVSPDPQQMPDEKIAWHLHLRSAGPPPVKTAKGWLVFYHANDAEGYKYKLGAMLLDLHDPTKIICRAQKPILEPDAYYENDGKPGIVYACGAVVRDGMLYVYYGGGDRVVCVASAPIHEFLEELVLGKEAELTTKPLRVS